MNTRATLRALVVAPAVVAACSDPAEPTLPAFSVNPPTQWSGGQILIRSRYLIDRNPLPVFFAAGAMLPLTRIDDSTVISALPRGPSGSVTVLLVRDSRQDSLGSVQRVGYSSKRSITPPLYGELLATDSGGQPVVLGGSFTGTANREPVVRLKVVPGLSQVLTLRQPSNTHYGIAPSATAGAFAVRDSTDSLRLATLLVDSPAIINPMTWAGKGLTRHVSQLRAGLWLVTGGNESYTRGDSCCVGPLVTTEDPWAVFMSPRGDRTTLATAADSGVPVWDNATGAVVFRLPLLTTEVVAFSSDGESLFAAGGFYSSDTLVAVDAASGNVVVPKLQLPEGFHAFGLAYHPVGGGQLLVAAANSTTLAVLVYRATTNELLGVLPGPDDCGPNWHTSACFAGVLIVNEAQSAAYIVIPGDPTPIWTFDLWPGP